MSAQTELNTITEADLLRLGAQDRRVEVVNGALVEMTPTGFEHGIIVGNITAILREFVLSNRLGYVQSDGVIYVLERGDEDTVRKTRVPDVSFVRRGRFPKAYDRKRPFPGAPDLAVEVMSPDDSATELQDRIDDYFGAGTGEIWVLYPDQRKFYQFLRGESPTVNVYSDGEEVRAGPALAGLVFSVAACFDWPDYEESGETNDR